jgi:hypothetical protein
MKPEIPIFKPRYPFRIRLLILLPTVLFFGILCNVAWSFIKFPVFFWLLALALGLITSLTPFFIIREIRFPDEMIVRRHFLPDRFFNYKEFEQINAKSLHAGGQRIRLGEITNLEELREMVNRWKAARTLKEAKHPTKKSESLYLQRGYGAYASFWGLMFGVIVVLMDPSWLAVDPRWVLGGTFLVVYFVYIYVIPKYL